VEIGVKERRFLEKEESENMWNEITNETELKEFWDIHYGFHDS